MTIQRYFATKGTSVLYVAKEKATSLPKNVWDGYKCQICGEASIESFPSRIKAEVAENGWYVDEK